MDSLACVKEKIRSLIAGSLVPEDPQHAENTLEWLLRLEPGADEALKIAALGHDIDRALPEGQRVGRVDFDNYDDFKAAHAENGARILERIMEGCGADKALINRIVKLVKRHEVGGDPRSDLLRDADSISYFDYNLPLYYLREGREETIRRCLWGYQRLSERMKQIVQNITYEDPKLTDLLKEAICLANKAKGKSAK